MSRSLANLSWMRVLAKYGAYDLAMKYFVSLICVVMGCSCANVMRVFNEVSRNIGVSTGSDSARVPVWSDAFVPDLLPMFRSGLKRRTVGCFFCRRFLFLFWSCVFLRERQSSHIWTRVNGDAPSLVFLVCLEHEGFLRPNGLNQNGQSVYGLRFKWSGSKLFR